MVKQYIVPWHGIKFSCHVELTERSPFNDYNVTQVYYDTPDYKLCLSDLLHTSSYGSSPRNFHGFMNRECVKETLLDLNFKLRADPSQLDWIDNLYLSQEPRSNQNYEIDYNLCRVMWRSKKGDVDLSILFHENPRASQELFLRFMGATTGMIEFFQNCRKAHHFKFEPMIVSKALYESR